MIKMSNVLKWNSLKTGLVLSGGGGKGAYEAGVITALYDLDMAEKIKAVSGSSIGALNALVFSSKQKMLCETIWNKIGYKNILNKEDLGSAIKSRSAVLSMTGVKDIILSNISLKDIQASPIKFYVCAYNLKEMKPEYFYLNDMEEETIIRAVTASASIPGIFPPVDIDGTHYADGGFNGPSYPEGSADNTPIRPLEKYDLDIIITVYLSDTAQIKKAETSSARIINIVPSSPLESVKGAGTLDFTKGSIKERIKLGYRDAMEVLAPEIMKYLVKKQKGI